jgi:chromosome segregation ATPase
MAFVTLSHDAAIAALQCEVDQLSELQLATAASALAREQEKEEVEKQLAAAERQLATLKSDLNETTDKERELAAEVAACRDEVDRWGTGPGFQAGLRSDVFEKQHSLRFYKKVVVKHIRSQARLESLISNCTRHLSNLFGESPAVDLIFESCRM